MATVPPHDGKARTRGSMKDFVHSFMLPVEGFCCRTPIVEAEQKTMRERLLRVNTDCNFKGKLVTSLVNVVTAKSAFVDGLAKEKRYIRRRAFGYFTFKAAEVGEDRGRSIDGDWLECWELKLFGILEQLHREVESSDSSNSEDLPNKILGHVFSSAASSSSSESSQEESDDDGDRLQQIFRGISIKDKDKEQWKQEPWMLEIEIWGYIFYGRKPEGGDSVATQQAAAKVCCTRLLVPKTQKQGGDPLVHSWLPGEDLLSAVEEAVNVRLGFDLNGARLALGPPKQ